jgi:YVTN family beta-propeller protein
VYVACATGGRVLEVDLNTRQIVRAFAVPATPSGLALTADGRKLYVTCAGPESRVCVIDTAAGRITGWLAAGHTATAPVLSPDGQTLYVCNRFNDDVSVIDLARKKTTRRVSVRREPVAAALTPDGRRLLVANHLPTGRADADHVGAVVSVIDVGRGEVIADLALPSGSSSLNDLRVAPDGRTAVVTHILARFRLPTTQVDRGWMNTNALTVIDLVGLKVADTVLLDAIDRGAANPWGAAWSDDGAKLVVAHAGTHEVSVIDMPALRGKLAKAAVPAVPPPPAAAYSLAATRTSAEVMNDLSFVVGLRTRRPLPAEDLGPRAVVVVGRRAIVANYFSDTLTVLELDGLRPKTESLALGPKSQPTLARRGEQLFHDARVCFQGWQSCATCHPGDGRVDALNWDLLNDGIGNPKNNKSLLYVFQTPPAMSIGVRESAAAAVRAGIRHILFTAPPPDVAEAIDAYLQELRPVPSPRRVKGRLSAAAQRGEKLFRSPAVGCATCHPGPLFTDLKSYDVGTVGVFDQASDRFDTPSLIELWRTAPYLHDGSAATLREVLTTANARDRHGRTSPLTAEAISDIVEYLLSL